MAVYLVQFANVSKTADLAKIDAAIKARGNGWFKYFDDSWLINAKAGETAEAIAKSLFPFMKNTDRLLVIQLERPYYGWLPKEGWDWLASANF